MYYKISSLNIKLKQNNKTILTKINTNITKTKSYTKLEEKKTHIEWKTICK